MTTIFHLKDCNLHKKYRKANSIISPAMKSTGCSQCKTWQKGGFMKQKLIPFISFKANIYGKCKMSGKICMDILVSTERY